MNRAEQEIFVKELSDNVAEKILAGIRSGKVPEEWDGHELRVLLAEMHNDSALMSILRVNPRGQRARAFRVWNLSHYL